MFKDKQAKREYQLAWIKKRRDEFFRDRKCSYCSSTKSLELDHIDPRRKVSHRIWSWSKQRRDEEISKCQVLCCDCHKRKSAEERRRSVCVRGHAMSSDNTYIRIRKTGHRENVCKQCHRDKKRERRRMSESGGMVDAPA